MKKSIFLFFAAILCATSASAWSYKSAANGWQASTSGFTWVTMNSGKSMDVVMLKDVGDGVNICQNDNGSGHTLYCKWTKTSGDIFRGTARWNDGLYSDETVVVPGGKVYIKVGSVILFFFNLSLGITSALVFVAALLLSVAVTLLLLPKALVKGKLDSPKRIVVGCVALVLAVAIMGIIYFVSGGFPSLNLLFV